MLSPEFLGIWRKYSLLVRGNAVWYHILPPRSSLIVS